MIRSFFLWGIQMYRRHLSPHIPPVCRFQPTCSHYAEEAIQRHGALKGGMLASWRMLRCHPWGASGWDPVPHGDWRSAFARRQAIAPEPPSVEGGTSGQS